MVQWNEVSASLVLLLGSQAVGRPVLVWSLEWNHQPSPNCVLFYFSMHGMRVCVSVSVCVSESSRGQSATGCRNSKGSLGIQSNLVYRS